MGDRTEYYREYRNRADVKEKQRQHQANWRERHPEAALALTRKNRAKHQQIFNERKRRKERIEREFLGDNYLAFLIKRKVKQLLKSEEIPKDLIEIERQIIFINRKLKLAK